MSRLRGSEANVAACFLLNLNLHFTFLALYGYTAIKVLLASPLGCSVMLNFDIQGMTGYKYSPFASVARYILVDAPRPLFPVAEGNSCTP